MRPPRPFCGPLVSKIWVSRVVVSEHTNLIHLTTNNLFLASIQTPLIRTLRLAVVGVSDFPLPNLLTTKISRLRHINAVFLFSSWNTSYTGAFWSLLTPWNQRSQAAIIAHAVALLRLSWDRKSIFSPRHKWHEYNKTFLGFHQNHSTRNAI